MSELTGEISGTSPRTTRDLAGLQLDVALYIENISSELRVMARDADLETLAYFLEMVRIEASIQVERQARSP